MHVRGVAQAIERARDGRQPRRSRPPGDLGDRAAVVQPHFVDARQHGRQLLDQPDAGGAVHAFEVQPRPPAVGAQALGGRRPAARSSSKSSKLRPLTRAGSSVAVLPIDQPVVLVEAPLADERVDLAAAGAAELLGLVPRGRGARGTARPQCAHAAASGRAAPRRSRAASWRRLPVGRRRSAGTLTRAACDEPHRLLAGVEAKFPGARLVEAHQRAVAAGCDGSSTSSPRWLSRASDGRIASRWPARPVTGRPSRSATVTSTGRGMPR